MHDKTKQYYWTLLNTTTHNFFWYQAMFSSSADSISTHVSEVKSSGSELLQQVCLHPPTAPSVDPEQCSGKTSCCRKTSNDIALMVLHKISTSEQLHVHLRTWRDFENQHVWVCKPHYQPDHWIVSRDFCWFGFGLISAQIKWLPWAPPGLS